VAALALRPDEVRIDGNRAPSLEGFRVRTLVGGDRLDAAISAASILAKTTRDASMIQMHARWPQYGFDVHKGYPTAVHLQALARFGACPEHRRSFAPVREVLERLPLQHSPQSGPAP
jgi:ribonuclease HII